MALTYGAMGKKVEGAVALTDNVATAAGDAIMITASTGGAVVTLTLLDTSTIVVNPVAGDNIYPFAVTNAHATSGTVTAFYNLSAP
jgi:hypothetical protein